MEKSKPLISLSENEDDVGAVVTFEDTGTIDRNIAKLTNNSVAVEAGLIAVKFADSNSRISSNLLF